MSQSNIQLPHQSTSNILQTTNKDTIHGIAYDNYGKMLATCLADKTIKIFKLINNSWTEIQQIKSDLDSQAGHTHKSAIINICWANSLFGSILASVSSDNIINIFELRLSNDFQFHRMTSFNLSYSIRSCLFSPYHLGLKLAIICEDGIIKIMECLNISNLSKWKISHQIIINQSVMTSFDNTSYHNNKYLIDTQLNSNTQIYCMDWNKSKWEFPTFCVGSNHNNVFIYGYISYKNSKLKWNLINKIKVSSDNNNHISVNSISWSNHMAHKYHLLACGCSDGNIRIIKIIKNNLNDNSDDIFKWNIINLQSCNIYKSLHSVEWNIPSNCLLSVGNTHDDNGNIYLWKKNRIQNKWMPICINKSAKNNKMKIDNNDNDNNQNIINDDDDKIDNNSFNWNNNDNNNFDLDNTNDNNNNDNDNNNTNNNQLSSGFAFGGNNNNNDNNDNNNMFANGNDQFNFGSFDGNDNNNSNGVTGSAGFGMFANGNNDQQGTQQINGFGNDNDNNDAPVQWSWK